MAALRSSVTSEATCTAYASSLAREVARGMAGSRIAARSPMIARTQTISSRTTPHSAEPRLDASARPALNVRRRAGATLLAVRAVRDDVIGAVLAWRSVDVSVPPGIIGNEARAQIRPVPGID